MELMNVPKIKRQLVLIINQPLKSIHHKQVGYSELNPAKNEFIFISDYTAGFSAKQNVQEEEPKKPTAAAAAPPTPPPKPAPSKFITIFVNQ